MLEEAIGLGAGLVVGLLPLLLLSVPGIILSVVLLLALAVPLVAIGAVIAVPPYLLARRRRRRGRRTGSRPAGLLKPSSSAS